jgi:hypothetical protein
VNRRAPGGAAADRQLDDQLAGFGPVAVAGDRIDTPAGGIEMDAGEPERSLEGALDEADALDLGEGNPVGHAAEATARRDGIPVVDRPG